MNLSFLTATILYASLILFIHYKLKDTEKKNVNTKSHKTKNVRFKEHEEEIEDEEVEEENNTLSKTIISLDNVDSDIENETIRDLKKFLATPEIKSKEAIAPIIADLDLKEYFDDISSISNESKNDEGFENPESTNQNNLEAFDTIQAFDDFGAYQNFATL